ncbi:MAG: YicC family protein [Verrucomicrobia bacterium]|nr:YicC family protein [Verrucomicrobiota bacterium]
MTGHGRAELASGGVKVAVELRAVNHRQFEARLDLPSALTAIENDVRARLHERIARGYVTCRVQLDVSAAIRRETVRVDYDLAAAFVGRLRQTGRKLGLKDDLTVSALLSMPGLVTSTDVPVKLDKLGTQTIKCLDQALKSFLAMRAVEGRELGRDIQTRLRVLGGIVDRIADRAPEVAETYRQALLARLQKAGVPLGQGDDRLIREVALFADRSDITEEVTRLRSHLKQARAQLALATPVASATPVALATPVGRTLDFLLQEMFREINTIGSKANDADTSRMVVNAKAELERIREQVQNVE